MAGFGSENPMLGLLLHQYGQGVMVTAVVEYTLLVIGLVMVGFLDAGLDLLLDWKKGDDSRQVWEVKTGASLEAVEVVEVSTFGLVGHSCWCSPCGYCRYQADCRHLAQVISWDRSLPAIETSRDVDGQRSCGKGSRMAELVLLAVVCAKVEVPRRLLTTLHQADSCYFVLSH